MKKDMLKSPYHLDAQEKIKFTLVFINSNRCENAVRETAFADTGVFWQCADKTALGGLQAMNVEKLFLRLGQRASRVWKHFFSVEMCA